MAKEISLKPMKFKDLKKFDVFVPYDSEVLESIEGGTFVEDDLLYMDRYFKYTNNSAIYMWENTSNVGEPEKFKPSMLVLALINV